MLLLACTGFGDATFVTERLGPLGPTRVVTVAVLFASVGSITDELTDTVSVMMVPLVVPVATFTTSVNVPEVPPARLTLLQTTLPVAPGLGVRQLHPAGEASETNVVLTGTGATKVALSAALGPLSVTTIVYVMLPLVATGFGDPAS